LNESDSSSTATSWKLSWKLCWNCSNCITFMIWIFHKLSVCLHPLIYVYVCFFTFILNLTDHLPSTLHSLPAFSSYWHLLLVAIQLYYQNVAGAIMGNLIRPYINQW
jgi:hypothetical protein